MIKGLEGGGRTAREKARVALDLLPQGYKLKHLLRALKLSRSTFFYQAKAMRNET